MMFKVAFRSIFRNSRRSVATMATIAIGATAMLVFGAYTIYVTYGLQTSAVERLGHLTISRAGYFDFGTGDPAAWGIAHYDAVAKLIETDPVLGPLVTVVTPVQAVAGIAGNFEGGQSRTFMGTGFVPSDRDRMVRWNEYGIGSNAKPSGLADNKPGEGIIGLGLARTLGLCKQLHLSDCPQMPEAAAPDAAKRDAAGLPKQDFSGLADVGRAQPADAKPHIDLLAATAMGAPNVVSLTVAHAQPQGVRELDDIYVGMNLKLAQRLVYGRGEPEATGIVVQLARTGDITKARARLLALFGEHHLDLEVHDFTEIDPTYLQILNLFHSIFFFIAIIIGIVVIFTVSNAMGMSVMERTDEIGTSRALGVRRSGIRRQFLMEGSIMGILGATLGVAFAVIVSYLVNRMGITYLPPGQAQAVPLRLYMIGAWGFVAAVWGVLVVVSTLAALFPANRAAKLQIVDALRHV